MKTKELQPPQGREAWAPVIDWPGRACCCTAAPMVKVSMPPHPERPHSVELYLCGHHYRSSRIPLAKAGASVAFRNQRDVLW